MIDYQFISNTDTPIPWVFFSSFLILVLTATLLSESSHLVGVSGNPKASFAFSPSQCSTHILPAIVLSLPYLAPSFAFLFGTVPNFVHLLL